MTRIPPGGSVEEWKKEAIEHHEKAAEGLHSTLQHAWRCGGYLRKIKTRVAHGRWLPWLKENFPESERTARYYMKLAEILIKVPDPDDGETTIRVGISQSAPSTVLLPVLVGLPQKLHAVRWGVVGFFFLSLDHPSYLVGILHENLRSLHTQGRRRTAAPNV